MTRHAGTRWIWGVTAFSAVSALALILLAPSHTPLKAASANAASPSLTSSEIQTLRSVGKAYYEQGKYKEAAEAFQKVVASDHAAALDHLDFAQALIQTNQLNQALEELTTASQMAPQNLAVRYNLGILYKHELRYTDAERELKAVAAADPGDPPTWFNLGDVYFSEHELEPSLDAFERVVKMGFANAQNFYVAATFHCFTILNRLKNPTEARSYLKLNMATRDKVPNVSLQYPALEAGKYGEVNIAPPQAIAQAGSVTTGPLAFQDVTSKVSVKIPRMPVWPAEATTRPQFFTGRFGPHTVPTWKAAEMAVYFGYSVAVGGDAGSKEIYVTVPFLGGSNYLLRSMGGGTFTDMTTQAGVAGPGGSLAAEFVDYNNSGHSSLVIAGLGGLTLYKNNDNETFIDVTKKAGLTGNPCELDTDVKAVDIDNDGLLDLVATGYSNLCKPDSAERNRTPNDFQPSVLHLYRNNGDGTFTDITASSGLEAARGHFRQVVFADFNNDGYMDLLFLRDGAPPMLFLNQGSDKFLNATAQAGPALANSNADEAAVSDFNHDGNFDLALWGAGNFEVLLNRGNARFEALSGLPSVTHLDGEFARRGAVADLDGNGFDDVLLKNKDGHWHALLNHQGRFDKATVKFQPSLITAGVIGGNIEISNLPEEQTFVAGWVSHPGDLDILTIAPNGQLQVFERQGPAPHWINVQLEGYKSNKQGIGDVVELKAGNFYDKVLAQTGNSVRIFTGNLQKLDVVRTTWPNQVVQNSINVPTDSSLSVKESERLASSCPFLYVWNGKKFVFFTDIMGASPLGELAPDGTYLTPNPQELVRLGSDLKPLNGDYVFQLTDEMREVDYFDQLRLLAVDHPANEDVYSNEIYSPTPVVPALYLVRKKRFPVSAVDDHGHNVLPLIRYADGRYPTDFRRNRILGLADPHSLTLDLGQFSSDSRVVLWLKGWVFWTDSNASRALMTNHKLTMTDPCAQVRDKTGHWVTVIPDMGLPSGTNRTMRVDLTGKFLTPDHHIRIVTDLCVYWDQIFFTTNEEQVRPSYALPLLSANLHYRGFSQVRTDSSHLEPDYFEYAHLSARAPWNPAMGSYTRYGPVENLLSRPDDELVAMASGDEMTVKFNARDLPPLKPGWKRDFFLYARGYAKDGEPNTAFARSVNPLPFGGMKNYPPPATAKPSGADYQRYLREYQTRPGYKLIPPLAPSGD
ncbi:MAG TPA: FG-GAP-like repeat-containing protein [Terriglobia bacterium]|nr:FG-GAP-like repeat-containing protein [Terriglobia bacterium]